MRLSKSRVTAGLQCQKQLWWRVHEPDAPELTPDAQLQAVFDQGHLVGAAAQARFPGGVLVTASHRDVEARLAQTQAAIASGAPAVFEASFCVNDVFVAVDVLERTGRGWTLVEVKSTTGVKEQHLPDVAVQLHVVERAGLAVDRVQLMHLNRACRYPDLSNLFVRADVTEGARAAARDVERACAAQFQMLQGALPDVPVGGHCEKPYPCPFWSRCWPEPPAHGLGTLYQITARREEEWRAAGVSTIHDLPREEPLSVIANRQRRAVQEGRLIVEPSLRDALGVVQYPLAVLDFETVMPAIPVWPGCRPYDQVPVQFSCHVVAASGQVVHHAWLADTAADPRPEMARRIVEASHGAAVVVAYNASFERQVIHALAEAVPECAEALRDVAARLVDALPLVRTHVYHPDFNGSFSLKSVYPALVGGPGYAGMEIAGGGLASVKLRRLLFDADVQPDERAQIRKALLEYCAQDTRGVVELLQRLEALAKGA